MRRQAARLAGAAAATAAVAAVVLCGLTPAGARAGTRPPSPPARPAKAVRTIKPARPIKPAKPTKPAKPAKPTKPAKPARPWTLTIPAIGVTARLVTLGLPLITEGGNGLLLPVPSIAEAAAEAGWYPFTAVPGKAGNAVVAGHVDTYAGPAVFYDLYRLRPGSKVYVTAGGAGQRFDVTSARELPKSVFPVNQVFGESGKHTLWLITCGGDFDYQTGHYLDNIVVSAAWDPARPPRKRKTTKPKTRQIVLRTRKK